MKTLKISQLRGKLLEVFTNCQIEDHLITRWGKPRAILIGEARAWELHIHSEKWAEFPEGIPVFVVIILGKEGKVSQGDA
jgi:hypothetical protein